MDLQEQKKVVEEYKRLNKQARNILKQMKESPNLETSMALETQFEEVQAQLDKIQTVAEMILKENENPPTDIVALTQAQRVWNDIRDHIRLAKYGDEGVQLPEIDMREIFKDKRHLPLTEVTNQILSFFENWQPPK